MKKILIILPLILFCLFAQSQINLDSLWDVWKNENNHDTDRLNAIHTMAYDGFAFSNPDSANKLSQDHFQFAKEVGNELHMAKALHVQSLSFYLMSNYVEAAQYANRSLTLYQKINYEEGIIKCYNILGAVYGSMDQYEKSINHFHQTLKFAEESHDTTSIASALYNIANTYKVLGDNENANKFVSQSLQIQSKINNEKGIADCYNLLGTISLNAGEYQEALQYLKSALKLASNINNDYQIAIVYGNIGNVYSHLSDISQALEYYRKSLNIREQMGDLWGATWPLVSIGKIYLSSSPSESIIWCSKAHAISQEIKSLQRELAACECLYQAYKVMGKSKEALKYHEQMLVLEDNLQKEEATKKLQQMEFQKSMLADSLVKEEEKLKIQHAHELEVQKKNRQKNIYLGIGILVLVVAFGITRRLIFVRRSRAIIAKEKDRSENLLLNILPAEIAEELKAKGRAVARDFDMVSILFTDFKEFTQTCSKLSAQELVTEINACFEAFDQIISKYKIEKIKTIGDSYMAAGGLPVPDEESITNTVMAALEMQEFISNRKAAKDVLGEQAFEMRAGIHTGPVVAGIVGVKKFQYDIWGDTVNIASRMENNGEVGKVNISQTTFDLLQHNGHFTFEKRDKVDVKGKGEMSMYFVGMK